MLTSNSTNSTLMMTISPLPCTLAPLAAVSPPLHAVAGPQYTTAIVQVQDCDNPCRANPLSRRTAARRGPMKKEKCGTGTTEERAHQTAVSPSTALLPWEEKGLIAPPPHPLPFVIIVLSGTYPHHRLQGQGEWHKDNTHQSDVCIPGTGRAGQRHHGH